MALVSKRNSFKNSILKLCKFADSMEETVEETVVSTYYDRLEVCFRDFQDAHMEVLAVTGPEELPFQITEMTAIEDAYLVAVCKYKCALKRISRLNNVQPSSSSSTTEASVVQQRHGMRLPKVHIPTFSGGYVEWQTYKALFQSLVHNSTTLSPVEKLFYLKTTIKGDAAKLIQNTAITDQNYTAAWDILVKRYDNERRIVTALLSSIVFQPAVVGDAESIRRLLDCTSEALRGLKNLERPVERWDDWIVFLIINKLDSSSRQRWEESLTTSSSLQSWADLEQFLEARFHNLEWEPNSLQTKPKSTINNFKKQQGGVETRSSHSVGIYKCQCCTKNHPLRMCYTFKRRPVNERAALINSHKLCFNCFSPDHTINNCTSTNTCRNCNRRHHTLLHNSTPAVSTFTPESNIKINASPTLPVSSAHVAKSNYEPQILLATAIIQCKSSDGTNLRLRALIDQGSQISFITEAAVQLLNSSRTSSNIQLRTVGSELMQRVKGMTSLRFQSRFSNNNNYLQVNAFILRTITNILPHQQVHHQNWNHISGLELADPTYAEPGRIDVLLGADIFGQLILDGVIKSNAESPIAQNTILGWVLSGKANTTKLIQKYQTNFCQTDTDALIRSFWELEEISVVCTKTTEELECESNFDNTHRRNSDGRYVVNLPFKSNSHMCLGTSRNSAVSSLLHMEKRFKSDPILKTKYSQFMQEYIDLDHMSILTDSELAMSPTDTYYLPHHAVFKESSTTTKLRVVFDASRKSSTGVSLNDLLHAGPALQNSLFDIIVHWRKHCVVFTADIAKMFRQILIDPTHTQYQRIVWRNDPQETIQDYRLKTVTYGVTSAPFLALKTLKTLVDDETHKFPLASTILSDMYVDDVCAGCDTVEDALSVQRELIQLFASGGFQLRKWSSNRTELLETLPPEYCEQQLPIKIEQSDTIKALGIYWHPVDDIFSFHINLPNDHKICTKRTLLSDSCRLFDPLGWLAPVIITAKLLFQRLWLLGVDWDDPLPIEIDDQWQEYRQELSSLENISIPRWLGFKSKDQEFELHGFSDASNVAYSAVVYCRMKNASGAFEIKLIAAKTKVAPVKLVTIPRLELCGAVLLTRLLIKIQKALKSSNVQIYAWCDSMVVLYWLWSNPCRWKTFIANRTSEILQSTNGTQWRYVKSAENPADCASRGLNPTQLFENLLWWSGPPWLKLDSDSWPKQPITQPKNIDLEERKSSPLIAIAVTVTSNQIINTFSSLNKLLRITSYCFRFINACKRQFHNTGPLVIKELNETLQFWIMFTQRLVFHDDINKLLADDILHPKSRIRSLNPIMQDDVLRVGGRLSKSEIPIQQKFPIILPKNEHLTSLLIADAHIRTLHGNIQVMLNFLRQRYWILDARNLIRKHIHQCITCFRYITKKREQIMADLPRQRVVPSRPFSHCGVDYAGPIIIKLSKLRSKAFIKGYIAVFVCMATRAVHLEAVTELSTSAFLSAFRRFISRRGICQHVYSDNGTNFVGAVSELSSLHRKSLKALEAKFAEVLLNDGIQWSFNPPGAPHFGGLWEAGVKSLKYHLKRVVGESHLTYEELSTLLCQIEAVMNSRPIAPLKDDISDYDALTPGHFLMMSPPTSIPEPSLLDCQMNRLTRWQRVQQIYHHFWKRWSMEYLSSLQQRPKWTSTRPNMQIGDLVLLRDENLPPCKWSLTRIHEIHPGADGKVRVVTLKTKSGFIKRPIVKLCPLPTLATPEAQSEMMPQQYCLRWKYHHSNLQNMFSQLLDRGCFCDVTLACEGQTLKAHRVVLCACSTYFDSILTNCSTEKDPIILMRDCKFSDIKCLIEFMYKGEINVEHSNLASLLKTAEDLRIKGLAEVSWRDDDETTSASATASAATNTSSTIKDELPTSEKRSRKQANALLTNNSTINNNNNNNNNINNQRTSLSTSSSSSLATSTILPSLSLSTATTTTTNINLNHDSSHHNNSQLNKHSQQQQQQQKYNNLSSSNHQPMAILTPKPINDLMAHPSQMLTAAAAAAIGTSASTSPPALSYPLLRDGSPQPSPSLTPSQQQQQHHQQQQQQQPPVKRKRGRPPLDGEFDNYSRPKMLHMNSNISKTIDNCNTKIPYHHIIANENMVSVILDESSQPSGSLTSDIADGTPSDNLKKHCTGESDEIPSTSRLTTGGGGGDDDTNISGRSNGNKNLVEDLSHNNADDSWNEPQRKSNCEENDDDNNVNDDRDDDGDSLRLIPKLERPDTPPDDYNEQYDGPGSPSDPNNTNDYLTPQEQEEWKDVVKMNDYLIKGRRPQFWEEPFTKRVMEAINNKDLEMKKAAALLGVSYGTLYGRYRETYGCLKHPYRHRGTNCDVSMVGGTVGSGGGGSGGGNSSWGDDAPPGPFQIIGLLQRGVITLPQAAELISCASSSAAKDVLLYQLSKESNILDLPGNNIRQLIKTDENNEEVDDDLLITKVSTNLPDLSVKKLKGGSNNLIGSVPSPSLSTISSTSSSSSSSSHSSSSSSSSKSSTSSSTTSRHHSTQQLNRKSITQLSN